MIDINIGEFPDPCKLPYNLMPRIHSFDEGFNDTKRHLRVLSSRIAYPRVASRDITVSLRFSRANGEIIADLTSLIKEDVGNTNISILLA
jgi:hypothetical protein